MSIELKTPSNGSVTLAEEDTASDVVVTIPAVNATMLTTATAGVPINGSAFLAFLSASQAAPTVATWTKIALNTTEFNTSGFDTTNRQFKPTIAGYYQFNALIAFTTSQTGINSVALYKNGSLVTQGMTAITTQTYRINVSSLLYLNGTTDYVELYVYCSNTSTIDGGVAYDTNLSGFLARSAT